MKKPSLSRRSLLRNAACGAGGLVGLAFLLGVPARKSQARSQDVLLPPPGAIEGYDEFVAACVRCGQCVQECPYDTLKLATLSTDAPVGTPYFVARDVPCEMCEDIPCVAACPSGALNPEFTNIYKAKMGLAVLLDQENCLAWQGLRCEICYEVCPSLGKAITVESVRNERTGVHSKWIPTVHSEHCTGCGRCEKACILDEAAIKVLPLSLARGKLGEHYRFGWQERDRLGHALVPSSVPMEIRMPEGSSSTGEEQ